MSIALAYSGVMQIELIQQRNDVPSMYRHFLAGGCEGLQHWPSWSEDCEEKIKQAVAVGWKIRQEGDNVRGKFVYFENGGMPGRVVEMSHLTPTLRTIFDGVREAAVKWDGEDPVRPMASLSAML